jgi:CRP-like cAMP-binding protein
MFGVRGTFLLRTRPSGRNGEPALDRDARFATATAEVATTLLALDRDSFNRAIEQNPVVARGVYRVLTARLGNTLAQVAAG